MLEELVEIQECPICGGPAVFEEESEGVYVFCMDCGAHSARAEYSNEEERIDAARRTAHLWNIGKVIAGTPGE